jgi:DNA-binding MarR family transcriptional regulator
MATGFRSPRTLGTALRHLLDLLDGDVEATYREAGLKYRPRYTPMMRALTERPEATIRQLADIAGVTHSAASQTIAKMKTDGIVLFSSTADGRERAVKLSARGKSLLSQVRGHWDATNAAADELDSELSARLSGCVEEAIAALERTPFKERIRNNAERLARRKTR